LKLRESLFKSREAVMSINWCFSVPSTAICSFVELPRSALHHFSRVTMT
jgi:hypothetical protein